MTEAQCRHKWHTIEMTITRYMTFSEGACYSGEGTLFEK